MTLSQRDLDEYRKKVESFSDEQVYATRFKLLGQIAELEKKNPYNRRTRRKGSSRGNSRDLYRPPYGPPPGSTKLYCVCQTKDDGQMLINCAGECDNWFHPKCVLTESEIQKHSHMEYENLNYLCDNCKNKRHNIPPHSEAYSPSDSPIRTTNNRKRKGKSESNRQIKRVKSGDKFGFPSPSSERKTHRKRKRTDFDEDQQIKRKSKSRIKKTKPSNSYISDDDSEYEMTSDIYQTTIHNRDRSDHHVSSSGAYSNLDMSDLLEEIISNERKLVQIQHERKWNRNLEQKTGEIKKLRMELEQNKSEIHEMTMKVRASAIECKSAKDTGEWYLDQLNKLRENETKRVAELEDRLKNNPKLMVPNPMMEDRAMLALTEIEKDRDKWEEKYKQTKEELMRTREEVSKRDREITKYQQYRTQLENQQKGLQIITDEFWENRKYLQTQDAIIRELRMECTEQNKRGNSSHSERDHNRKLKGKCTELENEVKRLMAENQALKRQYVPPSTHYDPSAGAASSSSRNSGSSSSNTKNETKTKKKKRNQSSNSHGNSSSSSSNSSRQKSSTLQNQQQQKPSTLQQPKTNSTLQTSVNLRLEQYPGSACRHCGSNSNTEELPLLICSSEDCIGNKVDRTDSGQNSDNKRPAPFAVHVRCGRLNHQRGQIWTCASCQVSATE